jgi:glycosyltransferase involved in cell wall biosynthesis
VIDQFTEIAALAKADTAVAIQQTDAAILSRFLPVGSVVTAPMAMVARQNNAARVPGRCLFVGGDSQANTLGLRWFLEHVWPRVLAVESTAHLRVCGDVKRGFSAHFPNVTFVGRVADLAPEYDSALVCLVPLVVGSGLKIKLVEALCHGRTGVATSVGVQGMHFDSEIIAVADEPVEFAAEVVDLLRNDARRMVMEARALNFGQHHFLADSCYLRLNPSSHPKVLSRAGSRQ